MTGLSPLKMIENNKKVEFQKALSNQYDIIDNLDAQRGLLGKLLNLQNLGTKKNRSFSTELSEQYNIVLTLQKMFAN